MENKLALRGQLAPTLSEQERQIVIASREKKVKDLNKTQIQNKLIDLISEAAIVLNHTKSTQGDIKIMAEQLTKDILYRFKFYTLKDLDISFYLGTRGELKNKPDEYISFSISQFYQWLSIYKDEIRGRSLQKQLDHESKQQKDDVEQKRKEWEAVALNNFKASYDNFLKNGNIEDPYGSLYVFMKSKGYINIENEVKQRIYLEELKKSVDGLIGTDGKIKGKDIGEIKENRRLIEKYRNSNDTERMKDFDFQKLVQLKCQLIAIRMIFENIKRSGKTLNEYYK